MIDWLKGKGSILLILDVGTINNIRNYNLEFELTLNKKA